MMEIQRTLLLALSLCLAFVPTSYAKKGVGGPDSVKTEAEKDIRDLLEPLLSKYCSEDCKLMSIAVEVDFATQENLAPGFDDVDSGNLNELEPASARVKLLIDEKVGPISRGRILDLIKQYLDNLTYPVKVDTELVRFPQPVGSASRVNQLREKISKLFRDTMEDVFRQFCPNQCMLADYSLQTELINPEEAQYGASGEFFEDNGTAIRIKDLASTILVDETMSPEEQKNILEVSKLKTSFLRNVSLSLKSLKFPVPRFDENGRPIYGVDGTGKYANGTYGKENKESKDSLNKSEEFKNSQKSNSESENSNNSTSNNSDTNQKQERYEKFEKIERVENGDAVQKELEKFKVFGLVFAGSVLVLLLLLAFALFTKRKERHENIQETTSTNSPKTDGEGNIISASSALPEGVDEPLANVMKRYEIERLKQELMETFAQYPKVAKQVFSRILTQDGVEVTAQYLHIFGEHIVIGMLRDPSLQSDLNELMEFYARTPLELTDDETLELLKILHNRTVSGKLMIMSASASNHFDFLAELDGMQILELIRNETLTVKAIVLTQADPQKRVAIYSQLDETTRMKLMTELSRIDYLPKDYIFNVAESLKRKRKENPRLNTEPLPGSEVLVSLLERSAPDTLHQVMSSLENSNPDSARTVKGKLVNIETLCHLQDNQLLEVVLSLKHDELIQFLKGSEPTVRATILNKAPRDLSIELEEEMENLPVPNRDTYLSLERKILNRIKVMANEGLINLQETNERLFSIKNAFEGATQNGTGQQVPSGSADTGGTENAA